MCTYLLQAFLLSQHLRDAFHVILGLFLSALSLKLISYNFKIKFNNWIIENICSYLSFVYVSLLIFNSSSFYCSTGNVQCRSLKTGNIRPCPVFTNNSGLLQLTHHNITLWFLWTYVPYLDCSSIFHLLLIVGYLPVEIKLSFKVQFTKMCLPLFSWNSVCVKLIYNMNKV